MTETIFEQRREYVYTQFGKQVENTHMSNSNKSKLMKKLWVEAKRKYR